LERPFPPALYAGFWRLSSGIERQDARSVADALGIVFDATTRAVSSGLSVGSLAADPADEAVREYVLGPNGPTAHYGGRTSMRGVSNHSVERGRQGVFGALRVLRDVDDAMAEETEEYVRRVTLFDGDYVRGLRAFAPSAPCTCAPRIIRTPSAELCTSSITWSMRHRISISMR